ncbi:hypothetical protein [Streptomyces sp. NPDC008092]|uniref:hypothetical protein n=1 Tax=Streptomyces sp. NPDC008092 TaxID=3364808 RepID=UPI0036E3857F
MSVFVHTLLNHPAFWVLLAVLLFAFVGMVLVPLWERWRPSSFTRGQRGGDLAWWGLLPADEQEAVDLSVMDAAEEDAFQDWKATAEAAEEDKRRRAAERAAAINALFHP